MGTMACINCYEGRYDGYVNTPEEWDLDRTLPCIVCGDVQPSHMTSSQFRKIVDERDAYETERRRNLECE